MGRGAEWMGHACREGRAMSVLFILMMASLGVAVLFLFAFLWSVRSGQFDDTGTPPMRILTEEEPAKPNATQREQK